MNKNPIANSLGISDLPDTPKNELEVIQNGTDKVAEDFDLARSNLVETIANLTETIATIAALADQSQSPRFYEVLATMFKTNIDASRELLALQKQARDIRKLDTQPGNTPQNVTNNLFVGTSNDLLRLIKQNSS